MATLHIPNTSEFDNAVLQCETGFTEQEYNTWMQQHSCILQEIYDEFELVIPADKLYALGDIINMLNVTTIKIK